jgi:phosphoglycolate phosphatase
MARAVIFDFDGTLTPLTLDFGSLRAEMEAIAGKYVDRETLRTMADHFILEMIDHVEEGMGEGGSLFREEALKRLTDLELAASEGKALFPYARDLLRGLAHRGIRTGVITRTSRTVIEAVFPDFRDYLPVVVTREDTRYLKPHPEHVRIALELIGVPAGQGLVVGDHPTDILAGKAAGAETAGVLTGRTDRDAFVAAGANHIVADIRGVMKILDPAS